MNEYDVIVVGGGMAGIGAAVGARQAGAKVLILETESCLGGAATTRNVLSICGLYTCGDNPQQAVGGVWNEIYQRLLKTGSTFEKPVRHRGIFQPFDPEGMKVVLDDICADNQIDVLFYAPVVSATRLDNHITSVVIHERHGPREIRGKAFVDASGDCDLAAYAGASVRYGNHGQINLGSLGTRFSGFAPHAEVSALNWAKAIREAKTMPSCRLPNRSKNSGVIIRIPKSGDAVAFLPSASYDARCAASISAAERQGRKQASIYLEILRQLPGHENMYIVSTGPKFGTRESRHINAKYQLTQKDVLEGSQFDDVIALGAWAIEYHDKDHPSWESSFDLSSKLLYDIPIRTIMSIDTPNLFAAGRTADGDQMGGASIRVMGTGIATGQAAGVAAALLSVHNIHDSALVQAELIKQGAILSRSDMSPPITL